MNKDTDELLRSIAEEAKSNNFKFCKQQYYCYIGCSIGYLFASLMYLSMSILYHAWYSILFGFFMVIFASMIKMAKTFQNKMKDVFIDLL